MGEKLCLVSRDRHPSPRGCGRARLPSGLPELGGWVFNFLFLFMISYKHMRFHKFFTCHKQRGLCSVRICVTCDATTCSIIGARSPGPARGTWGEVLPPQLPSGVGACCPAVVTYASAIPAVTAPYHLMDHFCPGSCFLRKSQLFAQKLFSQQQTCARHAVASPLLRSW